jgi:pimeloyl-ACP methyl ester carboxylesterase
MRFGGFGPWRPEWSMMRLPGLAMPVLGVLGLENETMGWGTQPDDVTPWLPPGARFVPLEGVGHFVHVEAPDVVASLTLEFLGAPPSTPAAGWADGASVRGRAAPPRRALDGEGSAPPEGVVEFVQHAKARLALHRLREGRDGGGRPLLVLHGLGEQTPAVAPSWTASWPGPVVGLDFVGHGVSSLPSGGGYSAEILLADADAAVEHLGDVTVAGRGLGAYVALMLAGARADRVRGAMLLDGPGADARSSGPGSSIPPAVDDLAVAPPDPFALAELSRDIRTPDYAAIWVRMALLAATVPNPVAVCAVNRPEWLHAVVDEPGVLDIGVDQALSIYAQC